MKKMLWCCLMVLLTMGAAAYAATYRVVNEEAAVRKDRRFFAPIVIRVPYGEKVESREVKGDWLNVIYRGTQGWIHKSAVTELKIDWTALAGGKAAESTKDEVALAGKGFTPEVEKAFHDKNPAMRYDLVNQVESYRITDEKIQAFIRAGKLREPGGDS